MERFLPTEAVVFLANVAWQSTVLLGLALAAERVARRQATVRHAILLAGLLAALGLPILLATQQRFAVAFLRVPIGFDASVIPVAKPLALGAPTGPPLLVHVPPRKVPGGRPIENALARDMPLEPPRIVGSPIEMANDFATRQRSDARAASTDHRRVSETTGQIARGAALVWLLGSAILAWRLLAACWALGRVRRESAIAEQPVVQRALELLSEVWQGPLPNVRVSDRISAPVSAGVLRPMILLPESVCQSLSTGQLRDVLLHEAAHIRRRDHLVVLLERLAAIAFWPNLLLHRLNFLMDEAREDICDNYVLSKGDAVAYSRTLLELTDVAGSNRVINLASCHLIGRRHLETRIASLLDERRTTMTRLRPPLMAAIFAGFLVLAATVAAVRAQVGPHAPSQPAPLHPPLGEPIPIESGASDIEIFIDPIVANPPSKDAPRSKDKENGPVQVRVVSTQGRPLRHEDVRLFDGDREKSIRTDSAGHFQLPTDWIHDRSNFSIIARFGNEWDGIGWYAPRGFGHTPEDVLRATIDMTVYPLSRIARGRLVDRAGRPAAGVRLKVTGMANKTNGVVMDPRPLSDPAIFWETISDAKGEYSLRLPDAAYCEVKVATPKYTAKKLVIPTDVDFAALGYVTLCEVGSIDESKLGTIELVEAGRIEGRVLDARTGQPLAKMSVGCQALARDYSTGWGEATSGADGRFRIEGLSPGFYNVIFLAPANFARTAAANDGVIVEPGKITTADLVVVDGRRLWGRVVDASSDKPMPGIHVGYYGPARPRSGAGCLGTTTDAKGEFSFRVPPGPSYVYIMDGKHSGLGTNADVAVPENQDFGPAVLQASSTGRMATHADVRKVGRTVTRVTRPFAPPPKVDDDGGVSGVIVDPAGEPIAGARIFHTGHPPDKFVTSDANGSFVFSGMGRGGSFSLVACKQGYHAWGGFPHSGAVLRIVLQPKPASPR
jgi:beta-lactamase regulating signal transducer with metallopeptidase domain